MSSFGTFCIVSILMIFLNIRWIFISTIFEAIWISSRYLNVSSSFNARNLICLIIPLSHSVDQGRFTLTPNHHRAFTGSSKKQPKFIRKFILKYLLSHGVCSEIRSANHSCMGILKGNHGVSKVLIKLMIDLLFYAHRSQSLIIRPLVHGISTGHYIWSLDQVVFIIIKIKFMARCDWIKTVMAQLHAMLLVQSWSLLLQFGQLSVLPRFGFLFCELRQSGGQLEIRLEYVAWMLDHLFYYLFLMI